jgi:hypothetical protein
MRAWGGGSSGVLIAVVLSLIVFAAPASAGQIVFEQDSEIWAMNDDGSNQHRIASAAQVPGMISLGSPAADASGVVVFSAKWAQGEAERTHWDPDGPAGTCGAYCVGVYKLENGSATRLSPDPYGCPLNPCLISQDDPELVPGGGPVVLSNFFANAGTTGCGFSWCITNTEEKILSQARTGGSQTDFGAACDGADDPSPKPDGSGVIAYIGCENSGQKAVIVSGPNGAGAQVASYDDVTQKDPSWKPDGSGVLTAENGNDPGVWLSPVPAAAGTPPVRIVADPSETITSPRFIGNDKVAYVFNHDIWVVPASCVDCAPTSGTNLTTSGKAGDFGWTPATSIRALGDVPGGTNPGGTNPGGTNPGGTNPGGTNPGGGDTTSPAISGAGLVGKTKLAAALKKGFTMSITTSEGGTATINGVVSGKDAKGLKLAATKTAASGKATFVGAGKHAVKLRFTKKAQKKFKKTKKLKLTLQINVVDAAGNKGTTSAKLTLKR